MVQYGGQSVAVVCHIKYINGFTNIKIDKITGIKKSETYITLVYFVN